LKTRIFFVFIAVGMIASSKLLAGIDDVCGTNSASSASYIPTSDSIKVFIIFAQFLDDPSTATNG
jgi:hypothetical protein